MKIKLSHPLISCICITSNRPQMLMKSILNFDEQDYPNKELIVSYPKSDNATRNLLNKLLPLLEQSIILVEREETISLGKARNEAILKANGNYICLWDDDDYYHHMRIKYQYNNMQVNGQYREACLLTRVILFDSLKNKVYHSFPNLWPGTLLCNKNLIVKYPFSDNNIAEGHLLIQFLQENNFLHYIEDFALLYSYVYHGQNTTNYYQLFHFSKISEILDSQSSDWVRANINQRFEFIL